MSSAFDPARLVTLEEAVARLDYLISEFVTGEHPRLHRGNDQAVQRMLMAQYRSAALAGAPFPLQDTELRFFSQNGEDGIVLYLLALAGIGSRRSVEICAGDGVECNTANLIVNHGFHSLLVDGGDHLLNRGQHFYRHGRETWFWPPKLVQTWVTAESVNDIILDQGFEGEIDVLSMDMDGVDYWVWKAIEAVQPRIVVAEFNPALGPDLSYVVPYDPKFRLDERPSLGFHEWYTGASLTALTKLAGERGLRLVGVQRYGFNAFFVRHDLATDAIPAVDPADCFTHPAALTGIEAFAPFIEKHEWVTV